MARAKKKITLEDIPSREQLVNELARVRQNKRFSSTVRSTIYILVIVAAAAVLIATLVLPIFQIYGSSMAPTLEEGDIVAAVKNLEFQRKDLVAFYYNNKILVKRVIANSGEWVDIDEEGNVYVNGELLDEPYLIDRAYGDCDIELPYQVPEGRIFVMGDHRSVSVDSRNSQIGCISDEQIAGRLILRVWPLNVIGKVE